MNQRFRLIDDDVFINCTNAILTRYKAVKGVLNIIITDDVQNVKILKQKNTSGGENAQNKSPDCLAAIGGMNQHLMR